MKFEELNDENFLLFAAAHFYDPRCSEVEDFYEDLHRIKYIKRLINRYYENGRISERLLLNHIIIFTNSFTVPATLRIFEYKIEKDFWPVLKPFLIYLKHIHEDDYPDIESEILVMEALERI